MRNRRAHRRIFCAHRIDMDELVIAGDLCKRIDAALVDQRPLGNTQFVAYERRHIVERHGPVCFVRHMIPWMFNTLLGFVGRILHARVRN